LPLSRRARIEAYLVVENTAEYRSLRSTVENEFINTFGGCTVIRGAKGQYLSVDGTVDTDDIDLVFADTPFRIEDFGVLSSYTDSLRAALLEATSEESILIVIHEIFHSL
jgi:16S rRNA G966 N2-methylase RsmD